MPKKYDVVAITGSYMKEGQEKKVYTNVGEIFNSGDRLFLKMTALPFDEDGKLINFFSLYAPKAKEGQAREAQAAISGGSQGQQTAMKPMDETFDDELPF